MDRQINKRTIQKQSAKKFIYGLVALIILTGSFYLVRQLLDRPTELSDLSIATVKSGTLENTISARGTVKPSSEILLTSPLTTRIQVLKLENGAVVKPGELIMSLNTEFAEIEYELLQEELRLKRNNVTRLKLQLEKNIRDIELDNKIKALEVQNYQSLLSDVEHLQKIGGATNEEIEQALQNLKIAELEKQKLDNELRYRKESLSSDIRNEEIQSAIQAKRLGELGKKIDMTQVKANTSGVITWINNNIGTQVNEGAPLVRIANLSSYSIDAMASDIHSDKIKLGMPVYVRINEHNIQGSIVQILPSVENNTIQFRVELEDPESDQLRPNMQVDIRVITGKKENTIYLANGPAFKGGKTQKLFVLDGDVAISREVEIGMVNTEKVEILSGLAPGEEVIISDMSAYENRSNVSVK